MATNKTKEPSSEMQTVAALNTGHLTVDAAASAPVGGVNEVLHSMQVNAAITAWSMANDARMEEWARTLGMDLDSFRVVAAKNPAFLAKLAENDLLAGAPNTTSTVDDFVRGKAPPIRTNIDLTGNEGTDLANMVRGRGAGELAALAETLVPADKRDTHIYMFDPPGRDGKVGSRSLIRKDRKSIEAALAKGFSPFPRGERRATPAFACDMGDLEGYACGKKMRSEADLQTHKEIKHPRQYQALKDRDARELQLQQLAISRQNLELQRRQLGLDTPAASGE